MLKPLPPRRVPGTPPGKPGWVRGVDGVLFHHGNPFLPSGVPSGLDRSRPPWYLGSPMGGGETFAGDTDGFVRNHSGKGVEGSKRGTLRQ